MREHQPALHAMHGWSKNLKVQTCIIMHHIILVSCTFKAVYWINIKEQSNLNESTKTHGIVPATDIDVIVQNGRIRRNTGRNDGTVVTTYGHVLSRKIQQLWIFSKLTAIILHTTQSLSFNITEICHDRKTQSVESATFVRRVSAAYKPRN